MHGSYGGDSGLPLCACEPTRTVIRNESKGITAYPEEARAGSNCGVSSFHTPRSGSTLVGAGSALSGARLLRSAAGDDGLYKESHGPLSTQPLAVRMDCGCEVFNGSAVLPAIVWRNRMCVAPGCGD